VPAPKPVARKVQDKASGAPAAPSSAPEPAPTPAPGAKPAAAQVWKVSVDDVKLSAGEIHLRDDPSGLDYPLGGLSAEVENIAMPQVEGQPMHAWLNMENRLDGSWLRARTPVVLQPLSVNAQFELGDLALAPFAAAVHHFAPMVVQDGRLGLKGEVKVAGSQVEARNVQVDLQRLAVHDETVKPGVDLSIGSLALTADRLAMDSTPSNFTLKADGIQKQGTLALKGSLVPQPLAVKTSVDLANFDVASLAPYIASSLNATVRSVAVGARGDAEFTAARDKSPMQVAWKGAVDVNNLDLGDRVNNADFLNWKHLGFTNMNVSMAGEKLGLALGDILLEDFYGNILLNNDARLNVMDLMVDKGKAAGSITQDTQTRRNDAGKPQAPEADKAKEAERQTGKAVAKPAPKPTGKEPDIAIASVTLKRGRMTFNDHFVRPNYRAEISAI